MRLRSAALVVLGLSLGACVTNAHESDDAGQGRMGDHIQGSWQESGWTVTALTETVAVATLDEFTVHRPLRLKRARLMQAPPSIEALGFVVTFLVSERAVPRLSGAPGYVCTDHWPLVEPGALLPLEGLELVEGERFTLSVIFRASNIGRWTFRGVAVDYQAEDEEWQVTSDSVTVEYSVVSEVPAENWCGHLTAPHYQRLWAPTPGSV